MSSGRRLGPLVLGATLPALLAGCGYTDTGPATGAGRRQALVYLVLLVVPALVAGVPLVWYHLRAGDRRRRAGGPPPAPVGVAVVWSCLLALLVGAPGAVAVYVFLVVAAGTIDTRAGEHFFLDIGWIAVIWGTGSVWAAVLMGGLALALRRGAAWARWAGLAIASLLVAVGLVSAALEVSREGNGYVVGLALAVLGAVPIPFLLRPGATDHVRSRAPAPLPPEPAPEPGSPARPLTDRWLT